VYSCGVLVLKRFLIASSCSPSQIHQILFNVYDTTDARITQLDVKSLYFRFRVMRQVKNCYMTKNYSDVGGERSSASVSSPIRHQEILNRTNI